MSKILITGGCGFIGSNLVRALVNAGHSVRTLDDYSRGNDHRLHDVPLVERRRGDVRQYSAVHSACRDGIDCVFHLAAVNGTDNFYLNPGLVLDVAIRGTQNIITACVANNIPELFLFSSSEVYQDAAVIPTPEDVALTIPDPLNPRYSYAAGKIASEMMVLYCQLQHFKRVIVLRPHNIYGPDMGTGHVIPQLARKFYERNQRVSSIGGVIPIEIQGDGSDTRAFCYIDDCISAVMTTLDYGRHRNIYNIGVQEETRVDELVRLMAQYYCVAVAIQRTERPKGSPHRRCPDISKINDLGLGWKPKVSLQEGLAKTLDWYKEALK